LEIQLSRGESWNPIVIGDSIIKRGELGSYCHWRFNYQEGRCWDPIVIGDSIIKRGDVGILLSLEIQLSRGEMLGTYCHWRFNYQEGRYWNPINWFNPATFLSLSQTRNWISNATWHDFFGSMI
jgi:hypothetical protein